jgi:hypothetical protein
MSHRKNSHEENPGLFGVESDDDWPMIPALIASSVIITIIFSIAIATI